MIQLKINRLKLERDTFVFDVSLELEEGRTGVLLGPSGCGKTTLLRCVAGLENSASGTIALRGREIGSIPPEERNTGFVFQDLALFDHFTGRENIEYGLRLRKVPKTARKSRVRDLARILKIEDLLDRKPFFMSGGERQRLAFARALASKPDILLLDEPLSSLDAPLRKELRAYLREMLSREKLTALHVTHDVEEAFELGDTIFLMKSGRIIGQGTPEELHDNPPDAWSAEFLGLGAVLSIEAMTISGSTVVASTALGDLECARQNCPADLRNTDRDAYRFFLPNRGACEITLHDAAISSTPMGKNTLTAIVRGSIFQGRYRRLVLQVYERPDQDGANLDGFSFEIETEPGFNIEKSDLVRVKIDGTKCRILGKIITADPQVSR